MGEEIHGVGYRALADAIVAKAAEDYKNVLNGGKWLKSDQNTKVNQDELEAFFKSSWFEMLTEINGPALMRDIKRLVIAK